MCGSVTRASHAQPTAGAILSSLPAACTPRCNAGSCLAWELWLTDSHSEVLLVRMPPQPRTQGGGLGPEGGVSTTPAHSVTS